MSYGQDLETVVKLAIVGFIILAAMVFIGLPVLLWFLLTHPCWS